MLYEVITLLQERRRTDVGGKHALLDHPVRIVAHRRHDVLDLALIVEQHHRLDGFEVDCAAPVPRAEQHLDRITSYNVCYTKLLRAAIAPSLTAATSCQIGVSRQSPAA